MQTQTTQTGLHSFYEWEKSKSNQVYLKQPEGDQWIDYTWGEVGNQARRMASALKAMNLPEKSNVGIISKNCAHWIIADLSIMMNGQVSVPFYPTLTADRLNEILVHSECKVLFVGKLDDWDSLKAGIPSDVQVITFPPYASSVKVEGDGFLHWDDLIANNEPKTENHLPNPDDLFTIIYTSGTTGNPKGVMYTYGRMANAMAVGLSSLDMLHDGNRYFSYLPLSHIAERNIPESASHYTGGTIYFAESLETFTKNLQEAKPTHFVAVPRIWTKFYLGILQKIPQAQLDQMLASPMAEQVKTQIKTGLGLAEAKLLLTGAAPMPKFLLEWYKKLGLNIQEVYGMTENVGMTSFMPAGNLKSGTVGQAYPKAEIKIDPDTNEILTRSPWVMAGYFKDPEKTAETLKDGWLHTGDMGQLDENGFLSITGRVKDTFKSAKGEFIAPAPIEFGFAKSSLIEQICVVGRGLSQPVALIVLSEVGQATAKEDIDTGLEETLNSINEKLLHYEKIHKVVVVKEAWSVENSVLTPTLKIKRNQVEAKYQDALENWYNQTETIIWE